MENKKVQTKQKQSKGLMKSLIKAFNSVDKKVYLTFVLMLGLQFVYGQDFTEVTNKVKTFFDNAKILINIICAIYCFIYVIKIAMAYWGGGNDGRQDAGGMIKKLFLGVIVWIVAIQLINGVFGTNFTTNN